MYAKAMEPEETTNTIAEVKAIKEGLAYCVAHQLCLVIMKIDSLVIKKIFYWIWQVPWCVMVEFNKIE